MKYIKFIEMKNIIDVDRYIKKYKIDDYVVVGLELVADDGQNVPGTEKILQIVNYHPIDHGFDVTKYIGKLLFYPDPRNKNNYAIDDRNIMREVDKSEIESRLAANKYNL